MKYKLFFTTSTLFLSLFIIYFFFFKKNSKKSEKLIENKVNIKNTDTVSSNNQSNINLDKNPEFIGSKNCQSCHKKEYNDWKKSDHFQSMQKVSKEFVHGDFKDSTFTHFGEKYKFTKDHDKYFVELSDEDSLKKKYSILFTFGHYPLQQYLVDDSDNIPGSKQALTVFWDNREKEEGGKNWKYLYPNEKIPKDDLLHWTGNMFNWNYMCAECHSTDFEKNFNFAKKSFSSTWKDINVSCESCHGPGSNHQKYISDKNLYRSDILFSGFTTSPKLIPESVWKIDPKTLKPHRDSPLENDTQLNLCGRCHSHRQKISDHYKHGEGFFDHYNPSILTDVLYHHDGQIKEEVYTYSSFMQSKMYAAGFRCTDCHDPHTMKLKINGNNRDVLCYSCHTPQKYAKFSHHKHKENSVGSSCISCHMPHKYYMVIDKRHDHSFRVPRPDLSKKIGVPNACNQCHKDKSIDWAVENFDKMFGDRKVFQKKHFGEVFYKARGISQSSDSATIKNSKKELLRLINGKQTPSIVSATALSIIDEKINIDQDVFKTLSKTLKHKNPLIRRHSVTILEKMHPNDRLLIGEKMLNDKSRLVRLEAVRILSPLRRSNMSESLKNIFDNKAVEYIKLQESMFDRPSGHMALGIFYHNIGEIEKAKESYKNAFEIDPKHMNSRLNLAELYWSEFNDAESGEKLIRDTLSINADNEFSNESLGRNLIRQKKCDQGAEFLKKSLSINPDRANIQYFCGVALNSIGKFSEAKDYLLKACALDPENVDYIYGSALIFKDNKDFKSASSLAKKLLSLYPTNKEFIRLFDSLNRK